MIAIEDSSIETADSPRRCYRKMKPLTKAESTRNMDKECHQCPLEGEMGPVTLPKVQKSVQQGVRRG